MKKKIQLKRNQNSKLKMRKKNKKFQNYNIKNPLKLYKK